MEDFFMGRKYTSDVMNYLSIYSRQKLKIFKVVALIHVKEELELVFGFIEIQKMRYGDKTEVVYEIEPNIDAYIPPLIIQTIVENAFVHAFDFSNNQNILTLRIRRENQGILIEIIHNGRGNSEEIIQYIYDSKPSGIDPKSTMKILDLIPGTNFKMASTEGEGTVVKMMIPDVKLVIT